MAIYRGKRMRLWRNKRGGRAQSLVEFALTLPVLLTILAGVVEVSNILMIYNRVQLAAREGARFGAMGGTNAGVLQVVQQASNNALTVADDRIKIWVVRPVILSGPLRWDAPVSGVNWSTTAECVYPLAPPGGPGCGADPIPVTPPRVLGDVAAITGTSAANINNARFVIAVVQYDADMILRLPWFSPPDTGGRFRMYAYAILRQEVEQTAITLKASGCSSYPMALNSAKIVNNDIEDKIFVVEQNDEDAGRKDGFAFTSWNISHMDEPDMSSESAGTCQGALSFPGNSVACDASGVACAFNEYSNPPLSPPDTSIHRNDWVLYNDTSLTSGSWNQLANGPNSHASLGRPLRIIVYDFVDSGPNMNPRSIWSPERGETVWQYKIARFAIVRVVKDTCGFSPCSCNGAASCGNKYTLAFKWVKWDESCGFE